MPKKKKGKPIAKILLVVVVIAVVAIGVVAWHDGLIGLTSINDINDGLVSIGTAVAIKGEVTGRLGNWITVNDGLNFVAFEWTGASALNTIVVVRGVVSSIISLDNVTSLDIVWIFSEY
ncbi:hypothetical protein EU528_07645 [Candidatus Thorarchaeota archaeon]|nr:MAG: hypothetical protein EU528_07645 [Candidatus Thorarchaeota archaeon]